MMVGIELEREVMGLCLGWCLVQFKLIELIYVEELELVKVKVGWVEWVGLGVVVYIFGILKEVFKKC